MNGEQREEREGPGQGSEKTISLDPILVIIQEKKEVSPKRSACDPLYLNIKVASREIIHMLFWAVCA